MSARRRVPNRLVVIFFGIALLGASTGRGHATSAEAARAFLAALTEKAIAQLSDESLPVAERTQRFRALFRENFDIPAIGRFVLGRYWRKATPEVRERFLAVFEDVMVQRFAPKFAGYAETRFEVGMVRPLRDEGQYVVNTTITPTEGEPLRVGWRVRENGGRFRILDVVGEGVSMALTLRSEYASVIKNSGGRVEGLIAQLREHVHNSADTQTTSNAPN